MGIFRGNQINESRQQCIRSVCLKSITLLPFKNCFSSLSLTVSYKRWKVNFQFPRYSCYVLMKMFGVKRHFIDSFINVKDKRNYSSFQKSKFQYTFNRKLSFCSKIGHSIITFGKISCFITLLKKISFIEEVLFVFTNNYVLYVLCNIFLHYR